MKVFISGVDTPVGHNVSRLFARSKPGAILKNGEEAEEEAQNSEILKENETKNYVVVGTLSNAPTKSAVSKPGEMHYSGKPKRDAARKEAIEKFSTSGVRPSWVSEVVNRKDRQALFQQWMSSDVIVYDLMNYYQEAQEAIDEMAKQQSQFTSPKVFIGISSILTWTRSVVDPEDPEASFLEQEYKRRRAHLDYRPHIEVERIILKLGKRENLKSFIINAGLLIHPGDHILHSMFRDAWELKNVRIHGTGENIIPMAHIDDLSNSVLYTAETRPAQRYILVVDEANNTLSDVAKAISTELGTGTTVNEDAANLLLDKRVTKFDYDLLRVNIRMSPTQLKEFGFDVKYLSGALENVKKIVQEYKDARGFHPVKLMLFGPPGTGKTQLAHKLAEFYEISVFSIDSVLTEAVGQLEAKSQLENEEEAQEAKKTLEEINEAKVANNNEWSKEHIKKYLRQRILMKDAKNQGYILDGFHLTKEEFSEVFRAEEDAPEDDEGGEPDPISYDLAPEFIFVLDSSDEFICKRIMSLQENEVDKDNFNEEVFMKRLSIFRGENTEEKTILNYFDELEIHPKTFSAEESTESLVDKITQVVGRPRNYGLSIEEIEAQAKLEEDKKAKEASEKEKREEEERLELLKNQKDAIDLERKLMAVKEQEQLAVEAQSIPLRQYLMDHVMPTLAAGLVQVCKVRPEDPIDYLAEYLFSTQINSDSNEN